LYRPALWGTIGSFFSLVNVFIGPAAAVVAISALYSISKD